MSDVDLGDVAVFVRVVQLGSFSAAARALVAPKSSVSRRVARLERSLGVRLLQRTTRSLALTEAGGSFFARVSTALAEVADAAGAAVDALEVPRGTVRMAAPADVGTEVLPTIVVQFLDRYPDVRVDVEFSAESPDVVAGRYDLALRVGRQRDPTLTSIKLQDMAFRLYAAPGYLDRAGTPTEAGQLVEHACVLFRAHEGKSRWQLHDADAMVEIDVTGRTTANDMTFVRRACVAGAGIALLPELVGNGAVASGLLRPVLPSLRVGGLPLYLVHPSSPYLPLKVAVLRDFLLQRFPR